jgi:pimeloyl-ACP methyl ester carboxylesterase
MLQELRSLLSSAGLPGPFILVGHSFGGLLARVFASLYPDETAGLVLLDPVSVGAWANCSECERMRLQLGVKLARRGVWLARFGLVRAALGALLAGARWFPQLAARVSGRQGSTALANLVGEVQKLPPEVWPMIQAHWSDPKCFVALAQYLDCLPYCAMHAAGVTVEHIPTIILSASTATKEEISERERWIRESSGGRHTIVQNSGHWLHLEHPDLVIEAIRELVSNSKELPAVQP